MARVMESTMTIKALPDTIQYNRIFNLHLSAQNVLLDACQQRRG